MNLEQLENEVLKLDIHARARLADRLLLSLDSPSEEEIHRLWAKESLRRMEDLESGKVKGRPIEEVMAELRAKLK